MSDQTILDWNAPRTALLHTARHIQQEQNLVCMKWWQC